MPTDFSGTGRKRPQLNINLDQLLVDNENPRLAEEYIGADQTEVISALYEQFDLDELALSMSNNGYFDEEPLVVVPVNLPKSFKLSAYQSTNDLQVALEKLSDEKKLQFKVLEGNRRTATAKLLVSPSLRKIIGVTSDFPSVADKSIFSDIQRIPAIVYMDEADVASYLGVRHIAGNLRWEAYAKAIYLARQIENQSRKTGASLGESIGIIRKNSADRTDSIKKQYTAYRILKELEEKTGFNINNIKSRFSLITEITNKPDIREYIALPNYNEIDFDKEIIGNKNQQHFEQVFTWVFGNGKDKEPLFKDSRLIGKRLAPILADEESTKHLIKHANIEEAYERSGGELKYFTKQIIDAQKKVENSLSIAYRYKGQKEVVAQVASLKEAVDALHQNII